MPLSLVRKPPAGIATSRSFYRPKSALFAISQMICPIITCASYVYGMPSDGPPMTYLDILHLRPPSPVIPNVILLMLLANPIDYTTLVDSPDIELLISISPDVPLALTSLAKVSS